MTPEPPDPVSVAVDDGVAILTIDRPDRRNAINPGVVRGLREGLDRAEADGSVRVLVLTGSGEKAFCAGGDLGGMTAETKVGQHFERAEAGELFGRLRASRLPVIARVNGDALAGGFGLMLACDVVIAVEGARMGMPEVDVGLWPFMVSAIVQREVPRKVGLDLMLTGRRIDASEGERWGFVNRVVPRAELDDAVAGYAATLKSKSPLVLSLGKQSFYASEDMAFDQKVAYLATMLTLNLESEDAIEGVTAFLQKRAPQWRGR